MIVISHRVNTIEQLKQVPEEFGVEVDLRDWGNKIILQHDPFKAGENFEEYMKHYRHRLIILNVKSEGIEEKTLDILKSHGIDQYFFLDLSFPAAVRLIRQKEDRIALRVSEYEPLESCLRMEGQVKWLWVDCFTKFPESTANWKLVRKSFEVCLVAPELQGRERATTAQAGELARQYLASAVCTKDPNTWKAAV